jgi:hypothetical protein
VTDIAEELAEKYSTVDSLEKHRWIGYGTATTRNVSDSGKPGHGDQVSKHASSQSGRRSPRRSTQCAGIAPPHAEGERLSGVTSDRESNVFISVPAYFVGGVPVTRARNPWAMPEASL